MHHSVTCLNLSCTSLAHANFHSLLLCFNPGTFILPVPKPPYSPNHNLSIILSFFSLPSLFIFTPPDNLLSLDMHHSPPGLCTSPLAGDLDSIPFFTLRYSIYSLCSCECYLSILDTTATLILCKHDFYCLFSVQTHLVLFLS